MRVPCMRPIALRAEDASTTPRVDELLAPLGAKEAKGDVPIPDETGASPMHALVLQELRPLGVWPKSPK